MSTLKKRVYTSDLRRLQSQETKQRILDTAKRLFEARGYQKVTIEKIAKDANISAPSIYSNFKSKRGILLALLDSVFFPKEQFQILLEKGMNEKSPHQCFKIGAQISRQIFDAERSQLEFLKGALILDPEFKKLEMEREQQRYVVQEEFTRILSEDNVFVETLTLSQVRDILWMFTGRDIYRMLVIERGWSSDEYEKWLGNQLIQSLLKSKE